MQVPAITVPENISESVLYFPANVCGLAIGELFIPETVVAIINIPEMTVPDFAECPFYVVLPPPIYYASSTYPLYEVEGLYVSTSVVGAYFIAEPVNHELLSVDSIYEATALISAELRNRHLTSEVESESITQITQLLTAELRPVPVTNLLDAINLQTSITAAEWKEYRYLSTDIIPEGITISTTVVSGSMSGFRYLTGLTTPDGISVTTTVMSGVLHEYRYLVMAQVPTDGIAIQTTITAGVLINV